MSWRRGATAAAMVLTAFSAAAQQSVPEVTVQARARRAVIERQVQTYVRGMTTRTYEGSLMRWSDPVCPLVAGLPQDQGEFVLRRISEVARTAGAPLAPEACRPNLLIVSTDEPDRLLRGWRARAHGLFGHEQPAVIRRFLERQRPVRVWYNADLRPARRGPMFTDAGGISPMFPGVRVVGGAEASRIILNVVQDPSSVIEIIDARRAKGVSIGQLADYVAMVGLAQIDLDSDLGDAPTILRLFSLPPATRPEGLSAWDSSFLEALYHTSQDTRLQRASVTDKVLRDAVATPSGPPAP
jgi:hypothetical protein